MTKFGLKGPFSKSLLLKSNVFYALSLLFIFDAPSQKLLELSCSYSRISFDAPSQKRLEFSGSNCLYPGDLIPFTRRPLFLIIDSDISYAFKAGLSILVHKFHDKME